MRVEFGLQRITLARHLHEPGVLPGELPATFDARRRASTSTSVSMVVLHDDRPGATAGVIKNPATRAREAHVAVLKMAGGVAAAVVIAAVRADDAANVLGQLRALEFLRQVRLSQFFNFTHGLESPAARDESPLRFGRHRAPAGELQV